MKQSRTNDLIIRLNETDWSVLNRLNENDLYLDAKTELFPNLLQFVFVSAIPSQDVLVTGNEKP